jgi:hypothetical protein
MKPNTTCVLEESNEIGIHFLRTELATGNTLLDVAEVTDVETTRMRTVLHAGRAYDLALQLMARLAFSRDEDKEMNGKLDALKQRLDSARSNSRRMQRPSPWIYGNF